MQNLYNKYGFKCYKFEIIEEIIDDDLLILIEQNYIDKIPEDLKINIAKANRHIITDLIKQKISVTRKERIKNGSIDLSNAYSAKSKKKEVRYNTTFYNLIHKETNKQLNMSIKELSQYFEVDIKKIDKYIREVLREGSRCKTLYGYYIKRIG